MSCSRRRTDEGPYHLAALGLAAGVWPEEIRNPELGTDYRRPLAIHAAMRPVHRTIDALVADKAGNGWNVLERLDSLFLRPGALDQLPTGAIVGKAILTRCNLITEDFRAKLSPQELDLGDFSIGRYAWEFHVMVQVDPPVKVSGKQGLWTWEGSLE